MTRVTVFDVPAGGPATHPLHAGERIWLEKNCDVDLWIALLNALGVEPLACFAFALAIDFEGDQWTFFKPSRDEMNMLYGIDVQELNVWRPLVDHILEHGAAGQVVCCEVDAFWLPDTAGTDYRRQHTKTSIGVNHLDLGAHRLRYFHNTGYHSLEGEDFEQLLLAPARVPDALPLFAETVRIGRRERLPDDELRRLAAGFMRRHLRRRPHDNPVRRFERRLAEDLPQLHAAGVEHYHRYAFATIRQLGAAFEALALHLQWRAAGDDAAALQPAIGAALSIADAAKVLILKGARSVAARRALDAKALFDTLADGWTTVMQTLDARFAG